MIPRIVLISFFLCNILAAQTFELQSVPTDKTQLGIRYLRPGFDNDTELSALSGIYEFTANLPVSSKLNLLINIPYFTADITRGSGFYEYSIDESGFGNVFIGIQTNREIIDNKKSVFTLGLFLPTADEQATYFSMYSDILNYHKYMPNSLTFYNNYAFHHIVKNSFSFGAEIGPTFVIPTEDNNVEAELYIHYGISPGIHFKNLLLRIELMGLGIITENPDDYGDRFVHCANFGAAWLGKKMVPKIFYKVYLKDYLADLVNGILGAELVVSLD